MGLRQKLKNIFSENVISRVKLMSTNGNYFTSWNGDVFENDIVRAALAARAKRISKIELKHCYQPGKQIKKINEDANFRFMLSEPNPYMTMNDFLEKMSNVSSINGNAFALIVRDSNGVPRQLYPIPAATVEAVYDDENNLFLKFILNNGLIYQFSYTDVIHIREDYNSNDIFGTSKLPALEPLMEIVHTADQGIIHAIKNSAVIRWLIKIHQALRDEDVKKYAQNFTENYLKISNNEIGVAAVDSKADAEQVKPTDFVPNAAQNEKTRNRILNLLNTNDKIIQSTADEDEENSYYESEIEPWIKKLSQEMTRKLFTPRQRGCGNYIAAGSFDLQAASLKTKVNLYMLVDRGALTVNEWRAALGLHPIDGGDKPIRRLDTQPVAASPVDDDEGGEE